MDEALLIDNLAEAERRVFDSERLMRNLNSVIQNLAAERSDTQLATDVLKQLQRTHELRIAHRDSLRSQLKERIRSRES